MQLAADYWSIDIRYNETKRDEWGYMGKIKFKRRKKFNQFWQGIQPLKETMLIQNEKLDKLTNITQNLENKLNGIQKKMVEY